MYFYWWEKQDVYISRGFIFALQSISSDFYKIILFS